MKISIASDHAGFKMKSAIKDFLEKASYTVTDFGAYDENPVDYTDTGLAAAEDVAHGNSDFGILICGTGIGMSMIANKVKSIRAGLCHTEEFAKLTRQHNNANILVLSGRYTATDKALSIVQTFINEPFSNEERHQKRIDKITQYEKNNEVENGKH